MGALLDHIATTLTATLWLALTGAAAYVAAGWVP